MAWNISINKFTEEKMTGVKPFLSLYYAPETCCLPIYQSAINSLHHNGTHTLLQDMPLYMHQLSTSNPLSTQPCASQHTGKHLDDNTHRGSTFTSSAHKTLDSIATGVTFNHH